MKKKDKNQNLFILPDERPVEFYNTGIKAKGNTLTLKKLNKLYNRAKKYYDNTPKSTS